MGRHHKLRQAAALVFCGMILLGTVPAKAAKITFTDVPENAWYGGSLQRIMEEVPGTINGMGDGSFAPDGRTTRAQFVKMLCAFSGEAQKPDFEKNYSGETVFTDVSGWSAPYVEWAYENGLAQGTSADRFSPGNAITREQIAVFLCHYGELWDGVGVEAPETALAPYYDGWKTQSWAEDAMKWAVSNHIMNGYDALTLGPDKAATRAQVVVMLCNYMDFRENKDSPPEPELPETGGFQPKFTQVNGTRVIDAPYIDQRVKYPTGCESVTAVMALQYLGVSITPEEFIDRYLPKGKAPHYDGYGHYVGCDPRKAFPGDPYSYYGWGCYAPVIRGAVDRVLQAKNTGLSVLQPAGMSLDSLCTQYVERGIPVALWATIDMDPPQQSTTFSIEGTGESFTWIYPMHCLLLVGRDSSNYYFNDPMEKKLCRYSKAAVERAYIGLGRQAVVVLPKG